MTDKQHAIDEVVIIGMGALGIMYGHLLEKTLGPGRVSVVADAERVARYRSAAITANDVPCHFSIVTPEQYRNEHAGQAARCVLFGVKHTALEQAIELARPIVGPETIMVSLLNGISSEEEIEAGLKTGQMLYCVAQQMAARRTGTAVHFTDMGVLCLGLPAACQNRQDALKTFEELLTRCGIAYVHEPDIVRRQWCKWMFNIGVNQTVMVHEGTFADVQKPGAVRDEFIGAMQEVVALAQKLGVDVSQRDVDEYLDILEHLPPEGMPSMRQDGLAQRQTEVEMFAGELLRRSRAVGLAAPVNASLYRRVLAMQSCFAQPQAQSQTQPLTQALARLIAHSSVRHFTHETVPEVICEHILQAAFAASSSCFMQVVSVIRVEDRALRARLAQLAGNQRHVVEADQFWVFVADYHRNQTLVPEQDLGWCEQLMVGCTDAAIVAQNAMVALEALGLGGVFVGGIRNGIKEVAQLLELPQHTIPVLGLAFGWPAHKNACKPRLPRSVTVMRDRYCEADRKELADYNAQLAHYFASRSSNAKTSDFAKEVATIMGKERRPFVDDVVRDYGWLTRHKAQS